MRKTFLMASVAFWPMIANADTFTVPMVPSAATVFPQGAIVQSRTVVRTEPGDHQIRFLVPNATMQRRLPRFDVEGATVLGLSARNSISEDIKSYLTEREENLLTQRDTLNEDRDILAARIAGLNAERNAVDAQATYLRAIRPATDAPQTLEDLQAISDFLPTALQAVAARQADIDAMLKTAQEEWTDLSAEIDRLNAQIQAAGLPTQAWWEVVLDASNPDGGEISITMAAFFGDAGWTPTYDVTLNEAENIVVMDRTATIYQNTGQGWFDVQTRLSSAEPFQRIDPTQPQRDRIDLFNEAKVGYSTSSRMAEPAAAPQLMADAVAEMAGPTGQFDGVEVIFTLPTPLSIGTGRGLGQITPLNTLELDVDVDRYANARYDENAHVRAQFRNDTGEPILSGQARFYRDDTLIGEKPFGFVAAGAQSDLFFGPDKTLPVTLKFLSEQSGDRGFFSQSNTRREEIAFEVENLGSVDRDIVLTYALPIAVDEDLDITHAFTNRPDRMDVDGEPGVAEWDIPLAPGETQAVGMTFTLTWPEGQTINWQP